MMKQPICVGDLIVVFVIANEKTRGKWRVQVVHNGDFHEPFTTTREGIGAVLGSFAALCVAYEADLAIHSMDENEWKKRAEEVLRTYDEIDAKARARSN